MEINVELLKEICNRYGVEFIENKPGGFQLTNKELQEVLEKIKEIYYTNNTSQEFTQVTTDRHRLTK